jgi:hypothetical protein
MRQREGDHHRHEGQPETRDRRTSRERGRQQREVECHDAHEDGGGERELAAHVELAAVRNVGPVLGLQPPVLERDGRPSALELLEIRRFH